MKTLTEVQQYVIARLRFIDLNLEADEAEAAWSRGKGWIPGSRRIADMMDKHAALGVWIDFANFQSTRD